MTGVRTCVSGPAPTAATAPGGVAQVRSEPLVQPGAGTQRSLRHDQPQPDAGQFEHLFTR